MLTRSALCTVRQGLRCLTCWLSLGTVHLALRYLSLVRVLRWAVAPRQPSRTDAARDWERALLVAARLLPWSTTCLDRSLTLMLILRRHGYPAEVWLGWAVRAGSPAHAWVECGGHVYLETPGVRERFFPFPKPLP